mmetsp:Transcript_143647/g.459636  ORF Transcript_143647/g.459636 Transcript_143647/m.459636 type:complete len:239 (-) Transcript_143647:2278-2994(-)
MPSSGPAPELTRVQLGLESQRQACRSGIRGAVLCGSSSVSGSVSMYASPPVARPMTTSRWVRFGRLKPSLSAVRASAMLALKDRSSSMAAFRPLTWMMPFITLRARLRCGRAPSIARHSQTLLCCKYCPSTGVMQPHFREAALRTSHWKSISACKAAGRLMRRSGISSGSIANFWTAASAAMPPTRSQWTCYEQHRRRGHSSPASHLAGQASLRFVIVLCCQRMGRSVGMLPIGFSLV